MDDGRTSLVVLPFGAPETLDGAEGGQDRSADPDAILSLGASSDLDLVQVILVQARINCWLEYYVG
jgi:hypothetical protein